MPPIDIYIESAPKRTFAVAVEWPGWSRGGKTEADALAALLAAGVRYADVAELARARPRFKPPASVDDFEVVDRLGGGSGTEFGVPSHEAAVDRRPLDRRELTRQVGLLQAAWSTFDRVAAAAEGIELRKGPRGGGRDLGKIRGHVAEAEEAYLRQLGRRPPRDGGSQEEHAAAVRAAMLETLQARVAGDEIIDRANVKRPWSPRYLVRRSAWHALDHAWEVEDRAIR